MILVTGATGFIGKRLCKRIAGDGRKLRQASRCPVEQNDVMVGELGAKTNWSAALVNVDCVVHLAARVHVMNDTAIDPMSEFRRVNVNGTLNLARQAAIGDVRRFIFISSIKVNGEKTSLHHPYKAVENPAPIDPYGISKYETEVGLRKLSTETGMEVVIIRPPLVYGPGVKANFFSMLHWLYKGLPLPFGAIYNRRSLVSLDNLVDLIVTCIDHPSAANEVFLVSDGEDMSTTELLHRMGTALGKPARLFRVPAGLLWSAATLVGKRDIAQRLLGSLQVDVSKTREMLGWTPPISVDEGLIQTARWYIQNQGRI